MNKINIIIKGLFFAISIIAVFFYVSCKNKCGTTTCQNSGTCSNNKCICPTGYSGNSCQNAWSSEYIGTYKCSRAACTIHVNGDTTWQSAVTVGATNGGYTVNISNFDNTNVTQVATVDSVNNITISLASGTYGVAASGTFASNKINLHYTTYAQGGIAYICNMTMIKE